MGIRQVVVVMGLVACSKAGPSGDHGARPPVSHAAPAVALRPPAPAPAPTPPPAPTTPAPTPVEVQMTAATLADDCGGSPPWAAPPQPASAPVPAKAKAKSATKQDSAYERAGMGARAKRRCEQTSMQLAITSQAHGTPTALRVKQVEMFDEHGKSLGELIARSPTVWADPGSYVAWDETIAPGQQLSVSYVLSQPAWGPSTDRWNKTYVVKAVVTVGGTDRTVHKDVHISAPASLPANVKT